MPDDRFLHRRAGHSQKVNGLTDLEFRVWIQYQLSADDFGVMRGTHHPLQNDNDHLSNRPVKTIQRCLDALLRTGLIRSFDHQGKPYVYQHDWQTWQKVAYPRTTTQPAPPAEALAKCDAVTQELFRLHPGGAGRKRREGSENVHGTSQECSPLTRASAPAKRLTATGERLAANGSEGGSGETAPAMDAWWLELLQLYPEGRRKRSTLVEQLFVDQLLAASDGPVKAWSRMRANLLANLVSHEWRVRGMAPMLDKYLGEGRWQDVLPAAPPVAEQLTTKTNRTLAAAAEVMKESV